jgi:DNA helicase-2/ATP-dependent DNA helicase PcrA
VVRAPGAIQTAADLTAAAFHQKLKRAGLVTYDTILHWGLRLLDRGTLAPWPWTHLFVDEFQDSSDLDARIYDLLPIRNKFYVGDPDQAVYSFRGGNVHNILSKARLQHLCSTVMLEDNYRSDRAICHAAQDLIEHNKGRTKKETRSVSSDQGEAYAVVHYSERDEITWLRDRIWDEGDNSQVAVLVRTNYLVQKISQALEAAGIPIARRKRVELPADWKLCRNLLALLSDPENDTLAVWFLEATRGVAVAQKAKLSAAAAGQTLNQFTLHIPDDVGLAVVPQVLAKGRISRESIELVSEAMAKLPPESRLPDLLLALAQQSEPTEAVSAGVTVTTIHAAKGREWDCVFLPAFEQHLIPGERKDLDIEEERRLAYVAFTRARHYLAVSYCQKREPQFCRGTVDVAPSQFIAESGL